ncbi:MAG: TIGR02147 family protein [Fibrobacteria bacterium]
MESIFSYTDYRRYLLDFFAERKRLNKHFSLRMLAERSGFKARDYLMRVMRGDRNLSMEGAEKLSVFFRFSEKQGEYFRLLVQFNQASVLSEKEQCFLRMGEIRKYGAQQRLRQDQFEYLSAWYHSALRSLLPVLDPKILAASANGGSAAANADMDWEKLARMLDPPLTAKQARASVELLMRLGLLQRDGKGRFAVAEAALSTGDEVATLGVAGFHRATMDLAKRSIDRHPATARDISGITMSVSQDGFRRIKAELRAFRKKIQAIASADVDEDMVYQLNLHLIPLTRHQGAP